MVCPAAKEIAVSTMTIVVALLVSTQSGLTPRVVQQLRDDVSRIYADAKVHIQWEERTVEGAVTITLLRSLPLIPGCESAFGCSILESEARTPPVALIASRAIWEHERPRPLLRGRLLAFVVAHELGHLIGLPHGTQRGIMHPATGWLPRGEWSPEEHLALAALLNPTDPNADQRAHVEAPVIVRNADVTRIER
jgi:hypothetical protein